MKTTTTHPQRKDLEMQIIDANGILFAYVFQTMHDGSKILILQIENEGNMFFLQESFIQKYSFR